MASSSKLSAIARRLQARLHQRESLGFSENAYFLTIDLLGTKEAPGRDRASLALGSGRATRS
jgi:hypothetical protein